MAKATFFALLIVLFSVSLTFGLDEAGCIASGNYNCSVCAPLAGCSWCVTSGECHASQDGVFTEYSCASIPRLNPAYGDNVADTILECPAYQASSYVCEVHSDCANCLTENGCVWCQSQGECMPEAYQANCGEVPYYDFVGESCPTFCNSTTVILGGTGSITDGSPATRPYSPNSDCSWLLVAGERMRMVVEFETFDILYAGSCNDKVSIYDNATLLDSACGDIANLTSATITGDGEHNVTVVFASEWGNTKELGFKFTYREEIDPGKYDAYCGTKGNCSECTALENCGWCEASTRCGYVATGQPNFGFGATCAEAVAIDSNSCSANVTAEATCNALASCSLCLANSDCGWCHEYGVSRPRCTLLSSTTFPFYPTCPTDLMAYGGTGSCSSSDYGFVVLGGKAGGLFVAYPETIEVNSKSVFIAQGYDEAGSYDAEFDALLRSAAFSFAVSGSSIVVRDAIVADAELTTFYGIHSFYPSFYAEVEGIAVGSSTITPTISVPGRTVRVIVSDEDVTATATTVQVIGNGDAPSWEPSATISSDGLYVTFTLSGATKMNVGAANCSKLLTHSVSLNQAVCRWIDAKTFRMVLSGAAVAFLEDPVVVTVGGVLNGAVSGTVDSRAISAVGFSSSAPTVEIVGPLTVPSCADAELTCTVEQGVGCTYQWIITYSPDNTSALMDLFNDSLPGYAATKKPTLVLPAGSLAQNVSYQFGCYVTNPAGQTGNDVFDIMAKIPQPSVYLQQPMILFADRAERIEAVIKLPSCVPASNTLVNWTAVDSTDGTTYDLPDSESGVLIIPAGTLKGSAAGRTYTFSIAVRSNAADPTTEVLATDTFTVKVGALTTQWKTKQPWTRYDVNTLELIVEAEGNQVDIMNVTTVAYTCVPGPCPVSLSNVLKKDVASDSFGYGQQAISAVVTMDDGRVVNSAVLYLSVTSDPSCVGGLTVDQSDDYWVFSLDANCSAVTSYVWSTTSENSWPGTSWTTESGIVYLKDWTPDDKQVFMVKVTNDGSEYVFSWTYSSSATAKAIAFDSDSIFDVTPSTGTVDDTFEVCWTGATASPKQRIIYTLTAIAGTVEYQLYTGIERCVSRKLIRGAQALGYLKLNLKAEAADLASIERSCSTCVIVTAASSICGSYLDTSLFGVQGLIAIYGNPSCSAAQRLGAMKTHAGLMKTDVPSLIDLVALFKMVNAFQFTAAEGLNEDAFGGVMDVFDSIKGKSGYKAIVDAMRELGMLSVVEGAISGLQGLSGRARGTEEFKVAGLLASGFRARASAAATALQAQLLAAFAVCGVTGQESTSSSVTQRFDLITPAKMAGVPYSLGSVGVEFPTSSVTNVGSVACFVFGMTMIDPSPVSDSTAVGPLVRLDVTKTDGTTLAMTPSGTDTIEVTIPHSGPAQDYDRGCAYVVNGALDKTGIEVGTIGPTSTVCKLTHLSEVTLFDEKQTNPITPATSDDGDEGLPSWAIVLIVLGALAIGIPSIVIAVVVVVVVGMVVLTLFGVNTPLAGLIKKRKGKGGQTVELAEFQPDGTTSEEKVEGAGAVGSEHGSAREEGSEHSHYSHDESLSSRSRSVSSASSRLARPPRSGSAGSFISRSDVSHSMSSQHPSPPHSRRSSHSDMLVVNEELVQPDDAKSLSRSHSFSQSRSRSGSWSSQSDLSHSYGSSSFTGSRSHSFSGSDISDV